jgi:hypothetical protein
MKDIGNAITNREVGIRSSPMAASIKENTSMGNRKESACILGPMDSPTKGSGSMDSNTARECGEESREIATLVNGEWARLKAMESMCGLTEIVIKEISNHASNMDKEQRNLQMEIFIKDSMQEESLMAMDSTIGPMEATLKEASRTD